MPGFRHGVVEAFATLGCSIAYWQVFSNVSGQLVSPVFKGQEGSSVTLEDGTDRLLRDVGKQLPMYVTQHPRRVPV
jgi:hypothetical protein